MSKENKKTNVISSVISPAYIKDVLVSLYDINEVKYCRLLQSSINDTYEVVTKYKKFVFRIYKYKWKDLSAINFEIDALNYLKRSTVNVSYPLARKDGNFITEINAPEGLRYSVLFSYANGELLEYKNTDDAHLYGLNVAKIHDAMKDFKSIHNGNDIDIEHMLNTSIENIKEHIADYRDEFTCCSDKIIIISEELEYKDMEYGFCHADLHGGNSHKSFSGLTFFDFDFCGYSLIAYDISVFRWGCLLGKKDKEWKRFIKGYKEIKNIPDIEIENSLFFVIIRDLWIMHLYINRKDTQGSSLINKIYLRNRIQFLKSLIENRSN